MLEPVEVAARSSYSRKDDAPYVPHGFIYPDVHRGVISSTSRTLPGLHMGRAIREAPACVAANTVSEASMSEMPGSRWAVGIEHSRRVSRAVRGPPSSFSIVNRVGRDLRRRRCNCRICLKRRWRPLK